jgi:hypothetical protein
MMSSKSSSQIGAIGSKSSQNAGPSAATNQYGQQQYMNHLYHQQQQHNSYYTNSTAPQQGNPYYSAGPTQSGATPTGNYGMFASHGTNNGPPPQPQQMQSFGSVGQFPIGSQMLNNLVINQQYRSGPVVPGNGNNASGSNSNAPSGYMKQQHQSQLQDPVSSTTFFKNNV